MVLFSGFCFFRGLGITWFELRFMKVVVVRDTFFILGDFWGCEVLMVFVGLVFFFVRFGRSFCGRWAISFFWLDWFYRKVWLGGGG